MEKFFTKFQDYFLYVKAHRTLFIVPGLSVLAVAVSVSVYAFTGEEVSVVSAEEKVVVQENVEPRTLLPVLLKDSNLELIGTVISNETASIFPRREGIVQDILVDIGDRVQKNQIIAKLLLPGVEGESAGMIAEKSAMLSQARTDYKNSQSVAQATIQKFEQELARKKIMLATTDQNRQAVLQQSQAMVDTTVSNETAKIANAKQEVDAAGRNLAQMLDRAFNSVITAHKSVENSLFGKQVEYSIFSQSDLLRNLNLYSTAIGLADNAVTDLKSFFSQKQAYTNSNPEVRKQRILPLMDLASELLQKTQDILKRSIPTSEQTQSDFFAMINESVDSRAMLLDMREGFQEAANELALAEKSLQLMESEQQSNIVLSQKDYEKMRTMQGSDIENLKAEISVEEKELELMKAEQQRMVDRDKTMVGVASAQLQQQWALNGNQEIRSSFTGIVSKRFIRVGEMVNPSMPVFELVDVPTTLAKKAKREIQFGLPEDYNLTLQVDNQVEFFVPTEPDKIFKAVVTRKSPQVDSGSRIFTVQARLDDSLNFPHNTSIRVRVSSGVSSPVYKIPTQVIVREGEQNLIWVAVPEAEPKKLAITVSAEDGEFAEISGDLTEATIILMDPPNS